MKICNIFIILPPFLFVLRLYVTFFHTQTVHVS